MGEIKWSEGLLGYTEGFYLLGSVNFIIAFLGFGFLNYDFLSLLPSNYVPAGWTLSTRDLYIYLGILG